MILHWMNIVPKEMVTGSTPYGGFIIMAGIYLMLYFPLRYWGDISEGNFLSFYLLGAIFFSIAFLIMFQNLQIIDGALLNPIFYCILGITAVIYWVTSWLEYRKRKKEENAQP